MPKIAKFTSLKSHYMVWIRSKQEHVAHSKFRNPSLSRLLFKTLKSVGHLVYEFCIQFTHNLVCRYGFQLVRVLPWPEFPLPLVPVRLRISFVTSSRHPSYPPMITHTSAVRSSPNNEPAIYTPSQCGAAAELGIERS